MKPKHKKLKGKVSIIDKFNKNPKKTNFYKDFQEIMIQRLHLNRIGKYHKDNIEMIIREVINRPSNAINTDIKDDFLLTCRVEPEIYLQIQETAKKITGDYIAMDELIYSLLTYFIYIYKKEEPINILPFKQIYKNKRKENLRIFRNRFRKYYKNTVFRFSK